MNIQAHSLLSSMMDAFAPKIGTKNSLPITFGGNSDRFTAHNINEARSARTTTSGTIVSNADTDDDK